MKSEKNAAHKKTASVTGTSVWRFLTSLPGVLTGIAAVMTAATGIYLAVISRPQPDVGASPGPLKPRATPTPVAAAAVLSDWEVVARDAFSNSRSAWASESRPADEYFAKFDRAFVAGKYRWDMVQRKPALRWQLGPYGTLTDFYVAVDVVVVQQSWGKTWVGLVFGHTADMHYEFLLRDGQFGLLRERGHEDVWLQEWTQIQVTLANTNRIAVLVDNGQMTFYVNDNFVGSYRDAAFAGGRVGLLTSGNSAGTGVVDFDNFELRRKPSN